MGNEEIERVSNKEGKENVGIVSDNGVKTVILYRKRKYKKRIKPTESEDTTVESEDTTDESKETEKVKRRQVIIPSKDGKSKKIVLVNPNIGSKDGRIKKKSLVGPGLDTYRGKFDRNLSKWDDSKYKVLINELNPIYLEYEEDRKNSTKYQKEVYSLKQEHLIQESYLWHIIQNCAKELDDEGKDRVFWEGKYKFFLHRKDEQ